MSGRVLVAGRSGQVATALGAVLPRHGFTVTLLGRPELDLSQEGSIERALAEARPDIVVNAAAYTAVDRAEDESAEAFAVNRDGPARLAAATAAAGIPLIHYSTDYVFDGRKAAPYVEEDPTGPLSVYGRSKLEGERAVAQAQPRHVILRTAWVCSPTGHNFLKTMLRLALSRPEIGVVDDQQGTPTFAADLAEATAGVARNLLDRPRDLALSGIFHAASPGVTTWCGFARAIFAASERHGGPTAAVRAIATSDYPTRAVRPANGALATGKLARVHGVTLPDWRIALDACLRDLAPQPA